jgi:hypothetical protein
MTLTEVFQGDRREQATDARGLPKSYARALKALDGTCAHCSQRAVIANGSGVTLLKVKLIEAGPVALPAYQQTTVSVSDTRSPEAVERVRGARAALAAAKRRHL